MELGAAALIGMGLCAAGFAGASQRRENLNR